jgi:hypothetical protein
VVCEADLILLDFHISFVVVLSVFSGIVVLAFISGVFAVFVFSELSSYLFCCYIIAVASYFTCAGVLCATYLASISSSVSIVSSWIVSNYVGGIMVVIWVVWVVGGYVWPPFSAVWFTWSCFMVATQSDAPSRSSKFLTLLRTPST